MSLANFWRRKVLRRADDDGPVYVLDLNSSAASAEVLDTPDTVHYGDKGSSEGRSVLILSVLVALLTVLAAGFALGVIFLSKPLARHKPSTDATDVGGRLKSEPQFSLSSRSPVAEHPRPQR
ncbi:hypothetical protein HPB52_000091 [Rhipicephalus sanguineus]|uniref:Uncharacterized protein n=1 Tax=Rhipicephalus sanguineus TaxID=34632 RepID=A0A9D4PTD4_RHISA|nr:hypothetical protein HPB52_000091 [Rhipicephalus sanguineus]